jgi:hypothetical protein
LRFVKHKGQVIFMIDFSRCAAKEILVLLEQVKALVARHAPNSMLILTDFTGAEVDKKTLTRMKEVATLDRPYVKRSAWVGVDSMPHVFYENVKSFSHREIPTFNTREEAMDWLILE